MRRVYGVHIALLQPGVTAFLQPGVCMALHGRTSLLWTCGMHACMGSGRMWLGMHPACMPLTFSELGAQEHDSKMAARLADAEMSAGGGSEVVEASSLLRPRTDQAALVARGWQVCERLARCNMDVGEWMSANAWRSTQCRRRRGCRKTILSPLPPPPSVPVNIKPCD